MSRFVAITPHTFRRLSGYLGAIDYEVRTPDGETFRIEHRAEHSDHQRSIYNGGAEAYDRMVVPSIGGLWRYDNPRVPLPEKLLRDFNAWLAAEHDKFVATLRAHPERYGALEDDDPLLKAPEPARAIHLADDNSWITDHPAIPLLQTRNMLLHGRNRVLEQIEIALAEGPNASPARRPPMKEHSQLHDAHAALSRFDAEHPEIACIFVGAFPAAIVYADRTREEHGDYKRLALLSYRTLILEVENDCPPALRPHIEANAAIYQARKGMRLEVSTCGQTVLLGAD